MATHYVLNTYLPCGGKFLFFLKSFKNNTWNINIPKINNCFYMHTACCGLVCGYAYRYERT